MEYSSHFRLNVEIFCIMLSILRNIIMDLNSVMRFRLQRELGLIFYMVMTLQIAKICHSTGKIYERECYLGKLEKDE